MKIRLMLIIISIFFYNSYIRTMQNEMPLNTQLLYAIEAQDLDKVKELIEEKGADINWNSKRANSPIIEAAKIGNPEILKYLLSKDKSMVDQKSLWSQQTPLMLAIAWGEAGNLEMVNILLENGANVNEKDNKERTPLMYSAMFGKTEPATEIVNLLLSHGADANLTDKEGNTALMLAQKHNNKKIIDLLNSN